MFNKLFIQRILGLAGSDDWEAAKLDEAADFHKGVHNEISPYIFVLSGYRQGDRVSAFNFQNLISY